MGVGRVLGENRHGNLDVHTAERRRRRQPPTYYKQQYHGRDNTHSHTMVVPLTVHIHICGSCEHNILCARRKVIHCWRSLHPGPHRPISESSLDLASVHRPISESSLDLASVCRKRAWFLMRRIIHPSYASIPCSSTHAPALHLCSTARSLARADCSRLGIMQLSMPACFTSPCALHLPSAWLHVDHRHSMPHAAHAT